MTTDEQLKAARVAFGRSLAIWRNRNDFSQNDIEAISRIAGSPIHNSQQSNVENAVSEPKGKYWIGLERLNQVIVEQDTAGLPDALKQRVREAVPFVTAAGSVATATELWAMAFGQAALPADLAIDVPAELTADDMQAINAFCRVIFEGRRKELNVSKKKAWDIFATNLPTVLTVKEVELIKDMVLDLEDLSAKACEKLINKSTSNVCPIREALEAYVRPDLKLPHLDEVRKSGASFSYEEARFI